MKSTDALSKCEPFWSLPSRERGLKSIITCRVLHRFKVAPFAGAWIEIEQYIGRRPREGVAPFAGAWIEIEEVAKLWQNKGVAPFAGAWIEMRTK